MNSAEGLLILKQINALLLTMQKHLLALCTNYIGNSHFATQVSFTSHCFIFFKEFSQFLKLRLDLVQVMPGSPKCILFNADYLYSRRFSRS